MSTKASNESQAANDDLVVCTCLKIPTASIGTTPSSYPYPRRIQGFHATFGPFDTFMNLLGMQ